MSTRTKKTRLNLRIPTDLLKWVKKHAEERGTTVTQLVILHFMKTRSKEMLRVDHDPFIMVDKNFKEVSNG